MYRKILQCLILIYSRIACSYAYDVTNDGIKTKINTSTDSPLKERGFVVGKQDNKAILFTDMQHLNLMLRTITCKCGPGNMELVLDDKYFGLIPIINSAKPALQFIVNVNPFNTVDSELYCANIDEFIYNNFDCSIMNLTLTKSYICQLIEETKHSKYGNEENKEYKKVRCKELVSLDSSSEHIYEYTYLNKKNKNN